MWTYKLDKSGTRVEPLRVEDLNAIREWVRCAMNTFRGEQPYLHPKYGIDITRIMQSTTPEIYLERSIRDTCELREDIISVNCQTWREGGRLHAVVKIETAYGELNLTDYYLDLGK